MAEQKQQNPLAIFRADLDRMAEDKKGLPAALDAFPGVTVERFTRAAYTAASESPDIVKADRRTLMTAILRCAQLGLVPDGREAAIVVRNTKQGMQAQAMPMYYGLIKSLRESGSIAHCVCDVIFENDEFSDYMEAGQHFVKHQPKRFGDRGEPIGAYAVFTLPNGHLVVEVMDKDEIEQVKKSGKGTDSQYSPWVKFPMEMWKKSAVRRGAKRIPVIHGDAVPKILEQDNAAHGNFENDLPFDAPAETETPKSESRLDKFEAENTEQSQMDDDDIPFDTDQDEVTDIDEDGEISI